MRLLDWLLRENDELRGELETAVPFVIDNVAEYLFGTSGEGGSSPVRCWDDLVKHYPCVVPPFDDCFFEFRDPWINPPRPLAQSYGVHIISGAYLDRVLEEAAIGPAWEGAFHQGARFKSLCRISVRIEGAVRHNVASFTVSGDVSGNYIETGVMGRESLVWQFAMAPVLQALALLSCKNVKTFLSAEEVLTRQQRRYEERHPDRAEPRVRFHMLRIEPLKPVRIGPGGDGVSSKKSLHICRGHFAEYSPEKPLFGKYHGRFWVASHVRGSLDQGLTVKGYEIGGLTTP